MAARVIPFPKSAPADETGLDAARALITRLGIKGAMRVAAGVVVLASMHRPDGKPTPVTLASKLIDLYETLVQLGDLMDAYDRDPQAVRRALRRAGGED